MREPVIYREIVKEGLQQGKQEEALAYTTRLLTRRVGTVAPKM